MTSKLFLKFISKIVDIRYNAVDEGIEIFINSFFFSPNMSLILYDITLKVSNNQIETLILR